MTLIATEREWIEVAGAVVAATGTGAPPGTPDVEWDGALGPGLVDLQVNGAAGHEVSGGDGALDRIEEALLDAGVTAYLAAVVTRPDEEAATAIAALARRARDPSSPLAGIHVEGPFLSPEHPGMHPPALLRTPDGPVPDWLSTRAIRVVTLAPELPGALALTRALAARGVVVSLGHSGAGAAIVEQAVAAGARLVTHLFNAMPAATAREPGLAGAALTDPLLAPMLIADGVHVDAAMLRLARAGAGDRLLLVSDAAPAAAAAPGDYAFAGTAIHRGEDGSVRDGAGRLAGSGGLLDAGMRGWIAATGCDPQEALDAAAARPRTLLGLPVDLEPDVPADLVLVAPDGAIGAVMRAGEWLRAPR